MITWSEMCRSLILFCWIEEKFLCFITFMDVDGVLVVHSLNFTHT